MPTITMKLKTSLAGPNVSLHRGDEYAFDVAEALRLGRAGFAGPTTASKKDYEDALAEDDKAIATAEAAAAKASEPKA
jgi:hypothetical protein